MGPLARQGTPCNPTTPNPARLSPLPSISHPPLPICCPIPGSAMICRRRYRGCVRRGVLPAYAEIRRTARPRIRLVRPLVPPPPLLPRTSPRCRSPRKRYTAAPWDRIVRTVACIPIPGSTGRPPHAIHLPRPLGRRRRAPSGNCLERRSRRAAQRRADASASEHLSPVHPPDAAIPPDVAGGMLDCSTRD